MEQNYLASVIFGAVTLVLIFALAMLTTDLSAMRLTILAAVAAWASCYAGHTVTYFNTVHDTPAKAWSVASMALLAWALICTLWAAARVLS